VKVLPMLLLRLIGTTIMIYPHLKNGLRFLVMLLRLILDSLLHPLHHLMFKVGLTINQTAQSR
jgi:hypothetical protein